MAGAKTTNEDSVLDADAASSTTVPKTEAATKTASWLETDSGGSSDEKTASAETVVDASAESANDTSRKAPPSPAAPNGAAAIGANPSIQGSY
jgi:hypothetical protein